MGYTKEMAMAEQQKTAEQSNNALMEQHYQRRATVIDTYNNLVEKFKRSKDKMLFEQLLRMRKQIEYDKITSRIKELLIISPVDEVDNEINQLIQKSQKVKYQAPEVFLNTLIKEKIIAEIPKFTGDQVLTVRKRKGKSREFVAMLVNDYLPNPFAVNVKYSFHGGYETLTIFMDNLTEQQMHVKIMEM
jgi:hypothetical protein